MSPHIKLGDDYLRAIGRITVNFSQLELYVSFSIWNLLGTDQRLARACIARTSFQNQLHLLASLARERMTQQEVNQMDGFIKKASDAELQRNEITHSSWGMGIGAETGTVSRSKETIGRRGFSFRYQRVAARDLERVADLIEEASDSGSKMLGMALDYAAPPYSLTLADLALRLARSGADEPATISQLRSVTGAVTESETEFKLAEAHCLAREGEEVIKQRATELLTRALRHGGDGADTQGSRSS
jgi:hypothetical protein